MQVTPFVLVSSQGYVGKGCQPGSNHIRTTEVETRSGQALFLGRFTLSRVWGRRTVTAFATRYVLRGALRSRGGAMPIVQSGMCGILVRVSTSLLIEYIQLQIPSSGK